MHPVALRGSGVQDELLKDIDNRFDYSERNTLTGFIDIALRAGK